MVVIDFGLDPEAARIRPDLAEGLAQRNLDGLEHPDIAPRLIERLDADGVDGGDEGRRAAVHDRRFRPVDLDQRVVDAKTAQSGQHMFGGGDQRPGFIAEDGGKLGRGYGVHVGGDFALAPTACMGADKTQTGIGVRRVQCQRHRQAGMDADA